MSENDKRVRYLIINEDEWLRASANGGQYDAGEYGEHLEDAPNDLESGGTLFSSRNDRMCCLGFCAKAAGIEPSHLRGKQYPTSLFPEDQEKFSEAFPFIIKPGPRFLLNETDTGRLLIHTNDDWNITDEERKEKLERIFSNNGVQITWIKSLNAG